VLSADEFLFGTVPVMDVTTQKPERIDALWQVARLIVEQAAENVRPATEGENYCAADRQNNKEERMCT
jgi:hypothetical protein